MTIEEFFENFNGSTDVRVILHQVGKCESLDIRAYQIKQINELRYVKHWANAEVCDWTVSDTVFSINVMRKEG